jgi:hypothetical protein
MREITGNIGAKLSRHAHCRGNMRMHDQYIESKCELYLSLLRKCKFP